MLKKIIILVFALLCLAALGAYLFTRPWFMARVVQSVVNGQITDWVLADLTFEKIGVHQNGLVSVEDARFTLKSLDPKKQKWQGVVPIIHLDSILSLAGAKKMTVDVVLAHVEGEEAQLQGISFKVTLTIAGKKWRLDDGSARIDALTAKGIALTAFEARFSGDQDLLTVDPWRANWAGGNLNGRLTIGRDAYTIHTDVSQADLSRMIAQIKDMRGRAEGTLDIEITTQEIHALEGYLNAPQGVELQAILLKPLLDYIPASTQKHILEQLIAANANIFFDHAQIRLENVQSDSLNLLINFDSKKLNLDIGVTVDLHVDGGLKGLFGRLPELLS